MRYCQKCGAYIPIDETACPACGYDTAKESAPRDTNHGQGQYGQGQATASQGQYTQDWGQASANQGQYAQDWGQTSASQGQYTQYRGQYTARNCGGRQQYEEPWSRPDRGRDPWADRGDGRKRKRGEGASPFQGAQRPGRQAFTVPGDISDNRYLSILCYLGPLFLIPYFLRKDSPFVRFHANQGLLLLIMEILIPIAAGFVPFFGWAVNLAGWIFTLVCFFKGINSAINGRFDKLPLIGDINLLK